MNRERKPVINKQNGISASFSAKVLRGTDWDPRNFSLGDMQHLQNGVDTEAGRQGMKNLETMAGEAWSRGQDACNDGKGHTKGDCKPTSLEPFVDCVWEDFVSFFLLGSQQIQYAAIYDLTTLQPLAVSEGFRIEMSELQQLFLCLQSQDLAYRSGIIIGGKHYKVRLADGRHGILARTEREGCTVCKTRTLIIIGIHDDRGMSARCNEEVMRLGDFLRRKAF